jgi:very-short-patch-repair endonuclease
MLQKDTVQHTMYYNAQPTIFARAKELRENMTSAEKVLWERLRCNQLGVRFKAQHPIDIFIADFYCHRAKLVVEVDGEIHVSQSDYDDGRTAELERLGLTLIRFTNEEVLKDVDLVIQQIKDKLNDLNMR